MSNKHARDREIDRLKKYANALGVRVNLVQKDNHEDSGDWTTDGTHIRVFVEKHTTKTDIVLTLIHELGHHLWFIHEKERSPDLKFDQALSYPKEPVPKKYRKKILEIEQQGADYWDVIVKDVNIKIAKWKIDMTAEFDVWQYEVYYETGEFPSNKQKLDKHKELISKYKPKG